MLVQPSSHSNLALQRAMVWLAFPPFQPEPEIETQTLTVLDDEEQRNYRTFRYADDAQQYLAAHLLMRSSLSQYAMVLPQEWQFIRGPHGKPEIAPHLETLHDLQFNLTHTPGLAACAVTRRVPVGVDVERWDRPVQAQALADRWFSRQEARQLRELPVTQQRARFIEYWTLKEAYIKARGGGLSIPLDGFSFQCDPTGRWNIEFGSTADGDPHEWQFASLCPTPEHCLAVAIHRPGRADLQIDICETSPRTVSDV